MDYQLRRDERAFLAGHLSFDDYISRIRFPETKARILQDYVDQIIEEHGFPDFKQLEWLFYFMYQHGCSLIFSVNFPNMVMSKILDQLVSIAYPQVNRLLKDDDEHRLSHYLIVFIGDNNTEITEEVEEALQIIPYWANIKKHRRPTFFTARLSRSDIFTYPQVSSLLAGNVPSTNKYFVSEKYLTVIPGIPREHLQ